MSINDVYNIETAVQYLARLYMMNDTAIDIVRDILLYIHIACPFGKSSKRTALERLFKSLQLENNELEKIASVL